jgi:hypothetical protein
MAVYFNGVNGSVLVGEKDKYVVVIPVNGDPYVKGIMKKKEKGEENMELLQSAVGGYFESLDRKDWNIDMRLSENVFIYSMVEVMRKCQYTKCYVNETGRGLLPINESVFVHRTLPFTGLRDFIFGDIALVVPKRVFESMYANADAMGTTPTE